MENLVDVLRCSLVFAFFHVTITRAGALYV